MGLVKEFKEFAVKGNAMDMAVGIIIGAAFGKIISSLVNDVIMPPLGLLTGGVDFSEKFMVLGEGGPFENLAAAKESGLPIVAYGTFIQHSIDFLIVAFAIFMVIRALNSMKQKEAAAPAAPVKPSEDIVLLREIRDSLAK